MYQLPAAARRHDNLHSPFPMEHGMQKRKLGNSGLEVSTLGYGCMGLNFAFGPGWKNRRLWP